MNMDRSKMDKDILNQQSFSRGNILDAFKQLRLLIGSTPEEIETIRIIKKDNQTQQLLHKLDERIARVEHEATKERTDKDLDSVVNWENELKNNKKDDKMILFGEINSAVNKLDDLVTLMEKGSKRIGKRNIRNTIM